MRSFYRLLLSSILATDIAFLLTLAGLTPLKASILKTSGFFFTVSLILGIFVYVFDALFELIGANEVFSKERHNILLPWYTLISLFLSIIGTMAYLIHIVGVLPMYILIIIFVVAGLGYEKLPLNKIPQPPRGWFDDDQP